MSWINNRSCTTRLSIAVLLLSLATASRTFAGPPTRFTNNGAYIDVYGTDASGCIEFYLNASRGGTAQAPETWLSYVLYNQCTGELIADGGGLIPNSAFRPKPRSATLTITPSNSANFAMNGITGAVKLTVTADGVVTQSVAGHTRVEYLGSLYHAHGSWTYRSGVAAGTLLGFDIARVFADLGEGRDRSMEIQRGAN
jgi:hypothetical protein